MRLRAKQTLFFYICVLLKVRVYSQGNFVFDSTNLQINALNINTKESEFGPFKIGNRLYYTSSRERKVGVINLDKATNHQMLDLYSGELKDSVTVIGQKPLANRVNNSLNQGSAFFDNSSSKLYYAGNVPSGNGTDRYKLALFSTELKDNKFLKPKIELLLPDTFSAAHPMIYDGRLYFSSNLKNGKGRADLYSAELVDGKWKNIKNLAALNSPFDDYFPFVVSDREIYFSSNRPGGFGNLDLYKYTGEDSSAIIQNLGKPINSKGDDYGIYMDRGQDKGYFTTNRNDHQDDIYHFRKTWPSFNNCVAAIRETYCYDLTDEKSLDTDSINGYFYEWDFGDGSKQKGISVTHCYLEPGNYIVNLNIIDVSTKAVFLNQTSLDLKVDSLIQLKINALDTMLAGKKFTVNTAGTYLPDKKITGYYFEVDDKRLRTESFEYSFAKKGNYKIKLGVEYEDLVLKTKGLMCTTLNVSCVDSAQWIPFEQREIDRVIDKFQARNIHSGDSDLGDMNYDAELAFNARLGLSREKLADKIDDYLSSNGGKNYLGKNLGNNKDGLSGMDEDAELAARNKAQQGKDFNGKNLGNNKDGLSGMDEDAELAARNKAQQGKDFNGKNLGNNKDGLSGMDEDAELAARNKAQQGKDFNGKNLGNNKDGLSGMDEDAELVARNKAQQGKDFNGKNLGNNKDGLSDMDEEAGLSVKRKQYADRFNSARNLGIKIDTLLNLDEGLNYSFRVNLGKSKTKRDTSILHSKGIYGVKEEFIDNEYYYTYGEHKQVNSIEKYYRIAVKAGIKDPMVIGYKNNVLVGNQSKNFKPVDWGDLKQHNPDLSFREKIKAIFKGKSRNDIVAGKSTLVEATAPSAEDSGEAVSAKRDSEEVREKELTNGAIPPADKKDAYILPVALKPDDVKIEDVHTPEGETAANSKAGLAEFVERHGNSSATDLQFRVQISAFKYRNRYEFPHLNALGVIENTVTEGGITRITIGGMFDTYVKALEHNKKVVAAGQKDAFVTAFYKGKRVYIENLEKMGIFVTK